MTRLAALTVGVAALVGTGRMVGASVLAAAAVAFVCVLWAVRPEGDRP